VRDPYLFHAFSSETITLVRNPHYWQAPKPYLQTVTFPAEASNTTAVLGLAEGKIQWAGVFSFDLQRSYVSRDPKTNHVGLYPNGFDVLYVNLHHYPLNMPVVRRAMSAALNRTLISQIGFSGYSPPVTNLLAVFPRAGRHVDHAGAPAPL
jgi:peptide/nickel transport system substrate-binding protein